jgi:hypothetical protein
LLLCKIVIGRVGVELGYALGKFGSERILEVIVVGPNDHRDPRLP